MTTLVTLERQIRELKELLLELNLSNNIEIAAAKIIKDISDKIDKCDCTKELAKQLNENKEIVEISDKEESNTGLTKYSYPNHWVGNEELGSSKNPGSLKWPFGDKSSKT